jgi:pyruvate dehydrogenase E1 component beta subunit
LQGAQAIREALDQSMAADPDVYVMGLGVPDPKGVFGTTEGLLEKYGPDRVLDMPTAENGMTGVAIGSALSGMRPVMVHQRMDFAILAMEQIVNQAAKWHYMFGSQASVPLVIRMVVGRGWGQGPQHSQSLHSWFAHIPGLKVIAPATPRDAKGLLISAIEDNNPVISVEHRWTHHITGDVPEEIFRTPIGKANVARQGSDLTIVGISHMALEAVRAAEILEEQGVSAEVVDVRTLRPLDTDSIVDSVRKTGRLIVADTSWAFAGMSGEIVALAAEQALECLKAAPRRVAYPDVPSPTSPALTAGFYPRAVDIARHALEMLDRPKDAASLKDDPELPLDIPDPAFTGPF